MRLGASGITERVLSTLFTVHSHISHHKAAKGALAWYPKAPGLIIVRARRSPLTFLTLLKLLNTALETYLGLSLNLRCGLPLTTTDSCQTWQLSCQVVIRGE